VGDTGMRHCRWLFPTNCPCHGCTHFTPRVN